VEVVDGLAPGDSGGVGAADREVESEPVEVVDAEAPAVSDGLALLDTEPERLTAVEGWGEPRRWMRVRALWGRAMLQHMWSSAGVCVCVWGGGHT
jgi:hypothetical protein